MAQYTQPQFSSLILTHNEGLHLAGCLESLALLKSEVIIVDSGSTDQTLDIAEQYGANIFFHEFETSSKQVNWALDNISMQGNWILRLDADERLSPELALEIKDRIPHVETGCTGFYMKRRYYFMGRWMWWGGVYPAWLLRLWRNGKARSEDNPANDHMILLEGRAGRLKHDFFDWNQKDLTFWTDKHNRRSKRRVCELLSIQDGSIENSSTIPTSLLGSQASRKRWMKYRIYAKSPKFFRSFAYFLYRYIFRLGFLDGKEGLIFHFLLGFWYHFLIDAKIFEMEKCRQLSSASPVPNPIPK